MEIPGYTILRELGRGGMAIVYLARQDRLGRQVALKVMEPVPGAGDDFSARFIKEGRIIAHLQHPRIVTIYDLDSVGDLHYFSMEFLPNGTLADKINAGLSQAAAIDILRRVAQALSIAHDNGVIHRDIKPQNILFRADGTPVLTDFGIARAASTGVDATALTNVGMIVGSPRYMSPEQSMSRPIDARSDLYSLGCVFYEMLTREQPYQAGDVISLAMLHCSAPLPELPLGLARFQPIIDRLLAKAPEERFGSTQALLQALEQLEQGIDLTQAREDEDATALATQVLQRAPTPTPDATQTGSTPLPRPSPPEPDTTSGTTKRPRLGIIVIPLVLLALAAAVYFGLTARDSSDPLHKITRELPPPAADRSPTIERYEHLALEHLRAGEFDRSKELIELALASQPEDPRLDAIERLIEDHRAAGESLEQARRLLEQNKTADSLSAIEQGLTRVPEQSALLALRAEVLEARRQARQATAKARHQEAREALEAGQAAEALRLVREGLDAVADDPELKTLQTKIQATLETDRNVREILSSATDLIAEGLLQDSLALIDKGLELGPKDQALTDLRATVERQIQRQQERQADKLRQQAEDELRQGALEQALATIERALILQPEEASIKNTRASILDVQERRQIQDLLNRANQALEAGKTQDAQRLVDSVLDMRPDDEAGIGLRDRIQTRIRENDLIKQTETDVQALRKQGRRDAALARVDAVLEKLPDNPTLLTARQGLKDEQDRINRAAARALKAQAEERLAAGDIQQAQVLIERGRQLDANNAELIELTERITSRQAAAKKQQQAITECLRLNPTRANPAVKLNAMTATFDCLLSIPKIAEEPTQLNQPLGQVRADLDAWMAEQPSAELAMKAFNLLERLDSVYTNDPNLRQLRSRLAARAGLLPEMVDIDGGCFLIGSPETETPREADETQGEVCVDDFSLAKAETRQRDFARFVEATDYQSDAERGLGGADGCLSLDRQADDGQSWGYHPWANWRSPNKYQKAEPEHPVSCVSANDASAYLRWLSDMTAVSYRLPTEAEWEYAARAATQTPTFWGTTDATSCKHANVADSGHAWTNSFECDDGHEWVAPVETFAPNPWGLHDMLGNLSEWTCSEYRDLYDGTQAQCAPTDSRAPLVLRGGGWNASPINLRSAYRNRNYPESRFSFVGFRIARDGKTSANDAPTPAIATAD
ncbi:Serine/threonine-protein kinase PrkC [Thiorhodovibrio winogradskyi]|uniref:Serine/threonine-protein kinase PrkC n=1 Tax=Thiorhodovibrio winogradskyi TaxID=77007 RepID=A0ABZ0S8S2_9GAMM|nr:SUMF1/EgtB/PvdO family nonheme iron enzyme [Thiorhodovibrio winogradskyi]